MKVHKAYKYKIHPTIKQQKMLARHFGCARWIYNYFLQYKMDQYRKTKKSATYIQMSKHLTALKKDPKYLWLNEVSRQCLMKSLDNLDTAFNNFFRKKAKYPKFKNRYSKQSFRTGAPFCSIKPEGIHLPLIGTISCSYELPEEYKLFSIAVSKTPTHKYYLSINVETEIPDPKIDLSKPEIGIDFGLKHFITTSAGEKIDHPLPFKMSLKRLRRRQRSLSRRRKESRRRTRQKMRVALINEKISNQRKDFLHKLSFRLVSENQAIYLEDLSIKGMSNRWGRKINDLGWRTFTDFSTYKGEWYGCYIGKIDRFFPSSRICSICGKINRNLSLGNREWDCSSCGTHHDRDENAAKNVLEYGPTTRNQRTGRAEVVNSLRELSRQA